MLLIVELSGGGRVAFPDAGNVYPVFSAGAGALIWDDDEPYDSHVGLLLELEVAVRVVAFTWADLTVGARAQSIGQGVSGGMRLGANRRTHVGIVAGLVVPFHR